MRQAGFETAIQASELPATSETARPPESALDVPTLVKPTSLPIAPETARVYEDIQHHISEICSGKERCFISGDYWHLFYPLFRPLTTVMACGTR
jgi:hypothetical protein